jgi:hypothetical protein
MAITLIVTLLASCASTTPIKADPYVIGQVVEVGNHLRVTLKSGETLDFKLVSIDDTQLTGEGVVVQYKDIQTIEVVQKPTTKVVLITVLTAALVVAVVVGALLLLEKAYDSVVTVD